MKFIFAALIAASALTATAASAGPMMGHHHRHQICSYGRHHHRMCHWG